MFAIDWMAALASLFAGEVLRPKHAFSLLRVETLLGGKTSVQVAQHCSLLI